LKLSGKRTILLIKRERSSCGGKGTDFGGGS
jgi:hypothetical protein